MVAHGESRSAPATPTDMCGCQRSWKTTLLREVRELSIGYCPHCWAENVWSATTCRQCGAALHGPDVNGVPYREKLLAALRQPEPETRARAATILGEAGEPTDARTIHALIDALGGGSDRGSRWDADLQMAAARSLGQLGVCEATTMLRTVALSDGMALIAGLGAVKGLIDLARGGCAEAMAALEEIALEAGREAIRIEACGALALLNEPE
jgi:hypothetical protein